MIPLEWPAFLPLYVHSSSQFYGKRRAKATERERRKRFLSPEESLDFQSWGEENFFPLLKRAKSFCGNISRMFSSSFSEKSAFQEIVQLSPSPTFFMPNCICGDFNDAWRKIVNFRRGIWARWRDPWYTRPWLRWMKTSILNTVHYTLLCQTGTRWRLRRRLRYGERTTRSPTLTRASSTGSL